MESYVLTIMFTFSFSLVFEMYKSDLKITHLILDHRIFLDNVDIIGHLEVAYFER